LSILLVARPYPKASDRADRQVRVEDLVDDGQRLSPPSSGRQAVLIGPADTGV
jgi:hypothetical protein